MNPDQMILALKLGQTIQIFDIAQKNKLKSYVMLDPVLFWRWLTPYLIALVTASSVFHWDMLDPSSEPVKIFDRVKELANHTIISYRSDPSFKWFSLVGLSQPQDQVLGNMQLFSLEKNISQPLEGYVSLFISYRPPETETAITYFCFAHRRGNQPQLVVRQLNLKDSSPTNSQPSTSSIMPNNFSIDLMNPATHASWAMDFPVSLEYDARFHSIYLLTKMGYLYIISLVFGKLICCTKLVDDRDTIFVTTPISQSVQGNAQPIWNQNLDQSNDNEAKKILINQSGFMSVNRAGLVLKISIDPTTCLSYCLSSLHDLNIASHWANNAQLSNSEPIFQEHFQLSMRLLQFGEAAKIALFSPNQFLRTPQTLSQFASIQPRANEPTPLLQYFGILLESGQLTAHESVEMTQLLLQQGRHDLFLKWFRDQKLTCSAQLGDLLLPIDQKIALAIYIKAECIVQVVRLLAKTGKYDQIIIWLLSLQRRVQWTALIVELCSYPTGSPDAPLAIQLAIRFYQIQKEKKQVNLDLNSNLSNTNPSNTNLFEGTDIGNKLDQNNVNSIDLDRELIANCLLNSSQYSLLTDWLLAVTEDQPSDSNLQDLLFSHLFNIGATSIISDLLYQSGFHYFNAQLVAEGCEKLKMIMEAIELYQSIHDQQRCLRKAHLIPGQSLVKWFSKLDLQDAISSVQIMIQSDPIQNMNNVLMILHSYWKEWGIDKCLELLEMSQVTAETIFNFLHPIWPMTSQIKIHIKFLKLAAQLGHFLELDRFCCESQALTLHPIVEEGEEGIKENEVFESKDGINQFENPSSAIEAFNILCHASLTQSSPLLILSHRFKFEEKMTQYLVKRHDFNSISTYLNEYDIDASPIIFSTLLDLEVNDDDIQMLLMIVDNRPRLIPLIEVFENRKQLRQCRSWIERLISIYNMKDPILHTSWIKICISSNSNPEYAIESSIDPITKQPLYDPLEVGSFAESMDPKLSLVIYEKGLDEPCMNQMVDLIVRDKMWDQGVLIGLRRNESKLWILLFERIKREVQPDVRHRLGMESESAMDQFVQVLSRYSRDQQMVSVGQMVTLFQSLMDPNLDLAEVLLNLLEPLIIHPQYARSDLVNEPKLQNLLFLTGLKIPIAEIRLLQYIKILKEYNVDAIASAAIQLEKWKVVFELYDNANRIIDATEMLIKMANLDEKVDKDEKINHQLEGLNKAVSYIESSQQRLGNDHDQWVLIIVPCWMRIAKAQMEFGQISQAIESLIKGQLFQLYHDLFLAIQRIYSKSYIDIDNDEHHPTHPLEKESIQNLVNYLDLVRQSGIHDPKVDSELIFSLSQLNNIDRIKSLLLDLSNSINWKSTIPSLINIGERLFETKHFQLAKLIFKSCGHYTRHTQINLILKEWDQAIESARQSQNTSIWKSVFISLIQAKEIKLSKISALALLQIDELQYVIDQYDKELQLDYAIEVLEQAVEEEGIKTPDLCTALAMVYILYKPSYLMEYIEKNRLMIQIKKIIQMTIKSHQWILLRSLYQWDNQMDLVLQVMIDHPESYDLELIKDVILTASSEMVYKVWYHMIEMRPRDWLRIMSQTDAQVEPRKVIPLIEKYQLSGYCKEYLMKLSLNSIVVNAMFDLFIDEEEDDIGFTEFVAGSIEDEKLSNALRLVMSRMHGISMKEIEKRVDTNVDLTSKNQYYHYDWMALAGRLSGHICPGFRRLSAQFFLYLGDYKMALQLQISSHWDQDAIETVVSSRDEKMAIQLLDHYFEKGPKHALLYMLYQCQSFVPVDVVIEKAWRYKKMEVCSPYWIQTIYKMESRIKHLENEMVQVANLKDQVDQIAGQIQNLRLPMTQEPSNIYPSYQTTGGMGRMSDISSMGVVDSMSDVSNNLSYNLRPRMLVSNNEASLQVYGRTVSDAHLSFEN